MSSLWISPKYQLILANVHLPVVRSMLTHHSSFLNKALNKFWSLSTSLDYDTLLKIVPPIHPLPHLTTPVAHRARGSGTHRVCLLQAVRAGASVLLDRRRHHDADDVRHGVLRVADRDPVVGTVPPAALARHPCSLRQRRRSGSSKLMERIRGRRMDSFWNFGPPGW